MSAQRTEIPAGPTAWTVDELAALVGTTVRTIRYYATLGLIPPPERRGRMAYYDDRHRARLELIRTMQEAGLSLTAIEQHLDHFEDDTSAEEINLRRTLAASWAPVPSFRGSRRELEQRAGRTLGEGDLDRLARLGVIEHHDGEYVAGPTLDVGVRLLDLDIPAESVESANRAITQHMDALALELREIMRTQVLPPLRQPGRHIDEAQVRQTMSQLSQLTLDSVMANFQRATGGLVDGSLLGHGKEEQ